ncbi:MAG TPA: hypothetical protein VFQ51_09020, partial [Vicinamibacteria bacterium]|nr:hypothetical protein [Vicinamibacteria bacterium]
DAELADLEKREREWDAECDALLTGLQEVHHAADLRAADERQAFVETIRAAVEDDVDDTIETLLPDLVEKPLTELAQTDLPAAEGRVEGLHTVVETGESLAARLAALAPDLVKADAVAEEAAEVLRSIAQ